ncbi:MAG: hypothetical protein HYY02_12380 [Chloroflexi bacterium]|nr:hypothetical protein [Chloroflexota bacterium]
MRKNLTKEKLKNGGVVFGGFCNINAPPAVEALGHLGFDFIIIDGEHGPMDLESSKHLVRAADAVGITPLARVAVNHPQVILRYLDMGCLGVQIPMVNTGAEAEAVANACRYPPVGRRGLAGVRANEWGLTGPLGEYTRVANQEVLSIVQVETLQAVDNVDDILAVREIDMVFVGPTDLSSAMGHPGEVTHPEVLAALERLGKAIRAHGKAAGTIGANPQAVKMLSAWGYNYFAVNVLGLFASAARSYITESRAATA